MKLIRVQQSASVRVSCLSIVAAISLSAFGFGPRILEMTQTKNLTAVEQKKGDALLVTGDCDDQAYSVYEVTTKKEDRDVTIYVALEPAKSAKKIQRTFYCSVKLDYTDHVLFGKEKVQIWPEEKPGEESSTKKKK